MKVVILLPCAAQHSKSGEGIIGLMSFPDSGVARRPKHRSWHFLLLVVLGFAVAYGASRAGLFTWPRAYDPLALPDLRQQPSMMTGWQMKLVDADAQNCAVALSEAGVSAVLKPDFVENNGCGKWGTLQLSRLSSARVRPEDVRCAVAARLYQWERHVVQPAARRYLGETIREITHFGSYQCRTIRGSTSMSEHATANAFDISGFRTANGKTISVLKDWRSAGAEGQFLRVAHDGLCEWFNLTLGPDYNADHKDHFHVDMGYWRSCR